MNVNNNFQFRSVKIFVKPSDEQINSVIVNFVLLLNITNDALLLRGPWNESSYFVKKKSLVI